MKKRFGSYFVIWAVLLVLFNVIAFLAGGETDIADYEASFWIGYTFITVTFFGQLICAWVALKDTNSQKLFYSISLFSTSYAGLISTFVFGGLCMLIPDMPYWIGIILCSIVLGINIISITKASIAIAEVERIDQKVKQQTFFIKSLTVDAETLMARAKSEDAKAVCKNVYEAIRYSDPMSSDMLTGVESQITIKFAALSNAVAAEDADAINAAAEEVLILVKDRNSKCKLLK